MTKSSAQTRIRNPDLTMSMCQSGRSASIRRKASVTKRTGADAKWPHLHFRYLEPGDTVLIMSTELVKKKKDCYIVEIMMNDGEIGWIHSKFLHFYPEV